MIMDCSTSDETMSSRNDGVHEVHVYEPRHAFTYLAVVTASFNLVLFFYHQPTRFSQPAIILQQVLTHQRSRLVCHSHTASDEQ